MRRRAFIAFAALASSLQALAKDPARIAVLGSGSKNAQFSLDQMTWLRSGLRAAGLIESQDFTLEERWAAGDYHQSPTLAAELIHAGAIITYGYDRWEAIERTGLYLKKILDGARAADLPIEQPTKFHLVVNLKAAGLLGIEVPTAVLAQADEVIE